MCGGNANFTFTVTAINSFGPGTASGASNAIGSPAPPTNVVETLENAGTGGQCNGNCDYVVTLTLPTVTGGVPLAQVCALGTAGLPQSISCSVGSPIFALTNSLDESLPAVVAVNAFGAVSTQVF